MSANAAVSEIAKISVVGIGMRSHAGIATKMFESLAKSNINILMITTSEIKISVLIHQRYTNSAIKVLHQEFNLG